MPISIASLSEVLTEGYVVPAFVLSTSKGHLEIHPTIWVHCTTLSCIYTNPFFEKTVYMIQTQSGICIFYNHFFLPLSLSLFSFMSSKHESVHPWLFLPLAEVISYLVSKLNIFVSCLNTQAFRYHGDEDSKKHELLLQCRFIRVAGSRSPYTTVLPFIELFILCLPIHMHIYISNILFSLFKWPALQWITGFRYC